MAQQSWRCPTCGASNVAGNRRCRICQSLVPPALVPPPVTNPAFQPYQAPPMPAMVVAPALGPVPVAAPPAPAPTESSPFLPPPGGWQPYPAPAGPAGRPPPPPPGGYPAPPPGWYPGAPPPARKRHTALIVISVVVPVLVLVALGLVFARSTDPQAAKDRDAANAALLTNADLGGSFQELEHGTFARSRGGVRIESSLSGCDAPNSVFESDGQASAESVVLAQTGAAGQVVMQVVAVTGSDGSAARLADAFSNTVRGCLLEAFRKGGPTLTIDVAPAPAPVVGNRATAFHGSVGANGAPIAGDVDIVIVQQGRAVVILFTVDTTGSLHGDRVESLLDTLLVRLAQTFGA